MIRSPWKNDATRWWLHVPAGSVAVTRAAMSVPTTAVPMLVPASCAVSLSAAPIEVRFSGIALTSATAQTVITVRSPTVSATMRAMESDGVIRTLAEPNLTAISGEAATFIAGGEFPIPAGYSCDPTTHVCTTQISFKKFGISLNFTPVVLSEGRISLRVMTEVSELSNQHSITVSQAISSSSTNSITIPSIQTRRAETTLEIPSGGSMAMAGLIQQQTRQAINGLPGVDQIPILGALFRSQDFVNNETELMVIVTPYVVRAVAQKELSRPDDGFAPSSDAQSALLGRMNRLYGIARRVDPIDGISGDFGFIID